MYCLQQAFCDAFGFADKAIPPNTTFNELLEVCYRYDVNVYFGDNSLRVDKNKPVVIIWLTSGSEWDGSKLVKFDAHAEFVESIDEIGRAHV